MTITKTSNFHRTARLGVCIFIGVAALTACGEAESNVAAGPGAAPPAVPTAAYVSPEQTDRAAMLAVRAEKAAEGPVVRQLPKQAPKAYVSPEQADRAAMLAVRNAQVAAEAEVFDRSADLDLGSALAREAAAEKTSAHASADSIDHQSTDEPTSAHRSADALEHWALSDGGS